MYAPHSVTLYNLCPDGELHITVLSGVFLDLSQNGSLNKTGSLSDNAASLFIPLHCQATDALRSLDRRFCSLKEFDRLPSRDAFWTIGPRDSGSGADCFFVKGEAVLPDASFALIRDRFDDVFRVTAACFRDFGSPDLHHWQIGGK